MVNVNTRNRRPHLAPCLLATNDIELVLFFKACKNIQFLQMFKLFQKCTFVFNKYCKIEITQQTKNHFCGNTQIKLFLCLNFKTRCK